jgi:hypothetical protein
MPADAEFAPPESDPPIEALNSTERELVGREWQRRADVELTSASLSARLVQGLLLDRASLDVVGLAARAVGEETLHAGICRRVAEVYLGRSLPEPCARPLAEPRFGNAPPEINRLLLFVLHSCVNETLATVCLREGLKLSTSSTVKLATQRLLRDDVNHSRMGWAHLASGRVSSDAKAHLARALPMLLRLGTSGWLEEPRADIDVPEHGVLGNGRFPSLVHVALTELVLPGFDHVGVDTSGGRAWYARSGAGSPA